MKSRKINLSRFEPISDWEGGPLRVYDFPLRSRELKPAEEYVPYGLGYAIPLRAVWPLPDGVQIHLGLIDGVLRVVGLEVGVVTVDPYGEARRRLGMKAYALPRRPWLTGKYLRGLQLDTISREAAAMLAVRVYRRPRGEIVGVNAYEAIDADAGTTGDWKSRQVASRALDELARTALDRHAKGRRGRKPVPPETIERAAEIARRAEADGVSADGRIQLEMGVARSTAKKYKARARGAGLLPPTPR